jgi:hypothetical protein
MQATLSTNETVYLGGVCSCASCENVLANMDKSRNYNPGDTCPLCGRISNNKLLGGESESGSTVSYCMNCGFWDYLEW